MTKIMLFPWLGAVLKPATCEIMAEQSGFLTGSSFLPWISKIVAGDVFTYFYEPFEHYCGEYALQHTEGFEDFCGDYGLQHYDGWES